ncbi:hypothetical protein CAUPRSCDRAFT_12909 [Caulochytrium protostelioides]|uniref:Uncharacterized protein n=1 Tax=Caulochytrium protostelioides TaxID=1555241 RepID=A0A4P9WQT0_9FUNG|nr:hypothetical protein CAUPRSCDRAFT_12909 [Caulochytrium protostelioides]
MRVIALLFYGLAAEETLSRWTASTVDLPISTTGGTASSQVACMVASFATAGASSNVVAAAVVAAVRHRNASVTQERHDHIEPRCNTHVDVDGHGPVISPSCGRDDEDDAETLDRHRRVMS